MTFSHSAETYFLRRNSLKVALSTVTSAPLADGGRQITETMF